MTDKLRSPNFMDKKSGSKGAGAIARRKSDGQEARIAYEQGDENPFEEGSRKWQMFERYKKNGIHD